MGSGCRSVGIGVADGVRREAENVCGYVWGKRIIRLHVLLFFIFLVIVFITISLGF